MLVFMNGANKDIRLEYVWNVLVILVSIVMSYLKKLLLETLLTGITGKPLPYVHASSYLYCIRNTRLTWFDIGLNLIFVSAQIKGRFKPKWKNTRKNPIHGLPQELWKHKVKSASLLTQVYITSLSFQLKLFEFQHTTSKRYLCEGPQQLCL